MCEAYGLSEGESDVVVVLLLCRTGSPERSALFYSFVSGPQGGVKTRIVPEELSVIAGISSLDLGDMLDDERPLVKEGLLAVGEDSWHSSGEVELSRECCRILPDGLPSSKEAAEKLRLKLAGTKLLALVEAEQGEGPPSQAEPPPRRHRRCYRRYLSRRR